MAAAVAGFSGGAALASPVQAGASFEECLCAALQQAPSVQNAALAYEAAALQAGPQRWAGTVSASPAARLQNGRLHAPSIRTEVNLSLPRDQRWTFSAVAPTQDFEEGYSASLRVTQPLHPFPPPEDHFARQEAEAAWRDALDGAALDAAERLFEIYHLEIELELALREAELAAQEHELARLRAERGELSPAQIEAAEDSLVSAENAVLEAAAALEEARRDWRTWSGFSLPSAPAPAAGRAGGSVGNLDERIEAVQAADLQVQKAELALEEARRRLAAQQGLLGGWQVQAEAGAGTSPPSAGNPNRTFNWDVGVVAQRPLFGRAKEVRLAEIALEQAQIAYEQALEQAAERVRSAYLRVERAQETVELRRLQLERAQRQMREAERRFEAGIASALEVTRTELQAERAALALQRAQTDQLLAEAAFRRAVGEPVWPDLEPVCPEWM